MKRLLLLVLALAILPGLMLFAGSQKEEPEATGPAMTGGESGMRIVDEKITLKFTRLGWTDVRPPAEELWMFKRYEEMTNVHIEWEEVNRAGWNERKNILIASADLPDCFYQAPFSVEEISNYGSQGLFTKSNDLISSHAPNLVKLMNEMPVVKKAMTMADGNIYSFPYVQPDVLDATLRYYINEEWLDNLGLEVPTSIDELTSVLRQFKAQDANKNGDPNDEWPIYYHSGHIAFAFERQLLGSYGLGNRGGQASGGMLVDMGPNGKVRFIPTDNRYKELWQQISRWWEEDLMQTETFAGGDYASWVADGAKDVVGFFSWVHPFFLGNEVGNRFTGITALEGPHGDAILTWIEPPVRGVFSYMITVENKYPVESTKWVDYFYGPEGSLFGYYGEEGVTYNIVNGKPQYIDAIKNYEGGVQLGSFQWVDNVYGGYYPMLDIDVPTRMEIQGKTVQYEFKVSADDHEIFMPDDLWTAFPATPEESEELSALLTDINAYINEMRPRFITGELNFGADWDDYVATLNRMGAGRYLEIRQKQYERYSK